MGLPPLPSDIRILWQNACQQALTTRGSMSGHHSYAGQPGSELLDWFVLGRLCGPGVLSE